MALIFGTNGNDTGATALQGTALDDYILGLAGNDQLFGKDGVDKVYGDDGNDFVSGGAGNDEVYGGTGNDELVGGAGADILDGSFGFDTVSYTASAAGVYIDLQYGAGQYTWGGDAAGDQLYNIEQIFGSQHGDIVFGRDGKFDEIFGDQGNDTIGGGAGADHLIGGLGFDMVNYTESVQGVNIDLATNAASGGHAEGDQIEGFEGVWGSQGADVILGTSGVNQLWGLAGNDTLNGRQGADRLYGGLGRDTLQGGGSADRFVYGDVAESRLGGAQHDVIADFKHAQGDKIDLSQLGPAGELDFIGNAAFTAVGQVQAVQHDGFTLVRVSTEQDGPLPAVFEIEVTGNMTLHAGDFVL